MPLYKITNRSSSSKVVLPISPSLTLNPRETRELSVTAADMEASDAIAAMIKAGLITVTSSDDPDTPNVLESASLHTIDPIPSSTRDLYVDSEGGDDANTGLSWGSPVKTIQHAINLFFSATRGTPTWDIDDHRTVHVKYTAGMAAIVESVVKPAHAGAGALIIAAEEELVHSGLVSGAFSSIAGHEVRTQLALTGASLTANTLQDDAFVVLQDDSAIAVSDRPWEEFPIVDNGVSTLDVVALDPGVATGFYHGATLLLDVVRPQVVWQEPSVDAFVYTSTTLFSNQGGPALIRGFELTPGANNQAPTLISDTGTGWTSTSMNTIVHRCVIKEGWSHLCNGGSVGFAGVIGDAAAPVSAFSASQVSQYINVRMKFYLVQVRMAEHIYIGGFDGKAISLTNNSSGSVAADCLDGGTGASHGSRLVVSALNSTETGASPPLISSHGSYVYVSDGARLHGTTGNTDIGIAVKEHSTVEIGANPASATLAGTNGDVRVGDSVVRSYGAGSATNANLFSIYNE